MIRIDVFDDPKQAKAVFMSFYQLIVGYVPFPAKTIAKAFNYMYREEYSTELGIPECIKDTFSKQKIQEEYVKVLKQYKLASGSDSIADIKNLSDEELVFNYFKLASKIIKKASNELYEFLYFDLSNALMIKKTSYLDPYEYNGEIIAINVKNLGQLLCGYMACQSNDIDDSIYKLRDKYKQTKEKKYKTKSGKKIFKKTKQQLLKYVFCYESLTKARQEKTYKFINTLGIKACPYCNRNYIQVVERKKSDDKQFHTRPDLDHFWNKETYPFLALSMRNLVPACKVCNLAKHDDDLHILYPYKEGVGNVYKFAIKFGKEVSLSNITNIKEKEYEIILNEYFDELKDIRFKKKAVKSKTAFGWDSTYSIEKDYALRVFQNGYIFNKDFQKCLVTAMGSTFGSSEEVKKAINPKLVPEDEFNSEPLSKFTSDIFEQAQKERNKVPNPIIKAISIYTSN